MSEFPLPAGDSPFRLSPMSSDPFETAVRRILEKEKRFQPEAYVLVRDALDYTVDRLINKTKSEKRHVSGRELLFGFRDYLLEEFGPMSATMLEDWGMTRCRDVGEIVFLFIEADVFGRQDSDTIEDFDEVYSFQEAFTAPFVAA